MLAALVAPATASAAQLKAGAAEVDASWHVGASAGQYASDGAAVDPGAGTYDPTALSTRRKSSYGLQSRLKVRAIVIEQPDGDRFAVVKNDLYIPQDLLYRRAGQLIEQRNLGIDTEELTVASTHNHSSPFYSSTAWGAWAFQDVFDVRFYNYYAERMADAVEEAAGKLEPAKVGASVSQFDKTHRHSYGPAVADDGTPAGYPHSNTDHDMIVVRFDGLDGEPIANLVNFGLHPEFLDGNDLISADYIGPLERMTDEATDALTIFTQSAVGTSEPERSTYHSIHERLEFTHREYGQAEYGARLMSNAIVDTWQDIADGTPEEPARFVPFQDDFADDEVAFRDEWFPGPSSHPYPGVSNCRSDKLLTEPQIPVVGLPDCKDLKSGLGDLGLEPLADPLPSPLFDPGVSTDDLQRLGVPVPENYSAPAYTGLEEDIDIHLQAFRIGDILFTICSCEQWYDQSRNIKTRTDRIANNEHLGFDWKNEGGPGGTPGCTDDPGPNSTCVNPGNTSQTLPPVPDAAVEKMHAQVTNPANGWNDVENIATAESEPADAAQIKGNFTHDDRCRRALILPGIGKPENDSWDKPCAGGEESPSAELGYRLTVAVGMGNDYNGYIASYREYQRGDHYRKALTAWGPHSMDYMSSRLVNMGRVLNGGDESKLLPAEFLDGKITADLANNDARAQALGQTGTAAVQGYEARLPDDGGAARAAVQPGDVERFDGTFFSWVGGSNYTDDPRVRLERKVGDDWETYARQSSEIPITVQYPAAQDAPAYETGSHEWRWTAHFEAFASRFDTVEDNRSTPPGTYRFVVQGRHRKSRQAQDYTVTSNPFEIRPWGGITVEDVTKEADGTVSFTVGPRSERTIQGLTGTVGPIDYPNTYTYPEGGSLPPFIKNELTGIRDPAAPGDFGQVEWFCTDCSFRPWIDTGDASTATVTFERADGSADQVEATESGGRWRTAEALADGESAYVAAGCVRDAYEDFNGAASARVGAETGAGGDDACAARAPTLTASDLRVDEGTGGTRRADLDVVLSSPASAPVTVKYATEDGSARSGSDYTAASGTLTIPAGATSRSIELRIASDAVDEPDERFVVNLSEASGAQLADTQAVVTIVDDDSARSTGGRPGAGPGGRGTPVDTPGCAQPVGRVRGRVLGRARLGRRRASQRQVFGRFTKPRRRVDRFCLGDGRRIRIGYLRGRAMLVLTSSRHYAIRGVRNGSSLTKLRRRVPGLSRGFTIGANRWYIAKGSKSRMVFKVRGRRVSEIGIADARRTRGRKKARRFLRSFS